MLKYYNKLTGRFTIISASDKYIFHDTGNKHFYVVTASNKNNINIAMITDAPCRGIELKHFNGRSKVKKKIYFKSTKKLPIDINNCFPVLNYKSKNFIFDKDEINDIDDYFSKNYHYS